MTNRQDAGWFNYLYLIIHFAAGWAALASPIAEAAEFKIATYNVWGVPSPFSKDPSRFRDIPAELDKLDADVVLMQETFTPMSRRATHVRTYPYYVRGPGFFGKVISSGLHILSRWPIIRAESRGFASCAGTDCLAHKGTVIATVERPDGLRVDIMDTHLNAAGSASVRKAQLDTLALTIKTYQGTNPLIVGGDFNMNPNEPEYNYLMKVIPSVDSFRAWADSPEGQGYPEDIRQGFSSDGQLNPWAARTDSTRQRIDYLLLQNKPTGPQLRLKSSRLIMNDKVRGRFLSDHFGVESTFEVVTENP